MAAVARKTFRGVPCFGSGKCYIVQRAGARIVDKIYEFQDGGGMALAQSGQRPGVSGTAAYDFKADGAMIAVS